MGTDSDAPDKTDIHVDLGERYMSTLNRLANEHYGGTRTQALRRGIHFLNKRHDEDEEQHHLGDQFEQKFDEIIELLYVLKENLESAEEEIEKLRQEPVVDSGPNRQASEEAITEVYDELKTADQRLSASGLIERTNLDTVDLGLALNTLIDEGLVDEGSKGNATIDRYGVHGVNYDG